MFARNNCGWPNEVDCCILLHFECFIDDVLWTNLFSYRQFVLSNFSALDVILILFIIINWSSEKVFEVPRANIKIKLQIHLLIYGSNVANALRLAFKLELMTVPCLDANCVKITLKLY